MSPQVSHYPRNRPEFKIELARKLGLDVKPMPLVPPVTYCGKETAILPQGRGEERKRVRAERWVDARGKVVNEPASKHRPAPVWHISGTYPGRLSQKHALTCCYVCARYWD